MSVDITSGIAYGYIIDESDIERAAELAQMPIDVLTDILYEEDMLIRLNGYSLDGNYILGYSLYQVEPGEVIETSGMLTNSLEPKKILKLSQIKETYFSFLEAQLTLLVYSCYW